MCSVPEEVAVVEGPSIPDEEEQFDPTETLRAARLREKQLGNIEPNWSGNIEFKASHREREKEKQRKKMDGAKESKWRRREGETDGRNDRSKEKSRTYRKKE